MNIYIFGTSKYASDIYDELEKKDVSIYLDGEIKIIEEAQELLDAIKNKSDDDIFLIDDEIISKENRKKSLFSFFSKKKFLIEEKDIEGLTNSILEVDSLQEATTKILEHIDNKSIQELEELPKEKTNLETTEEEDIEKNVSELYEPLEVEENTEDLNFDAIDTLNEQDIMDALKGLETMEDPIIAPINKSYTQDEVTNLVDAFEQLLTKNKKIKITLEVV